MSNKSSPTIITKLNTFLTSPAGFDLILLTVWVLWVGRSYLTFDMSVIPSGREYGSAVASHHIWTNILTCGWCALWDGSQSGGFPAFANIYSGLLHPITAISTLALGVVNGSKLIILASLWFAGFSQWWLAIEMGVGRVARIWPAMLVVVGGHLATRMEMGLVTILLSTAMVSLYFPALLYFNRRRSNKSLALLALVISSAIISGQGYLQYALAVSLPASLLLFINRKSFYSIPFKKYITAIFIGILISATLLVPLINFLPNFIKWTDPEFNTAQSTFYAALNLVIDDPDYYQIEVLDKLAIFSLYPLFIGWVPIMLSFIGLMYGVLKSDKRIYFLGGSTFLIFAFLNPSVLKWLGSVIAPVTSLRFSPFSLGLVITPILGLAAYGTNRLLGLSWPSLYMEYSVSNKDQKPNLSLKYLILIPLVFSLKAGYDFSHPHYITAQLPIETPRIIEALSSDSRRWVATPFGEHYWITYSINESLSLSPGILPFSWKNKELPMPSIEASRTVPLVSDVNSELVTDIEGIRIYIYPDEFYAEVSSGDFHSPCKATGLGGSLQVHCTNKSSGTLIVKENYVNGWRVWLDEIELPFNSNSPWLSVDVPGGSHTYTFRYLPLDVPLGLFISAIGFGAVLYLIVKKPDPEELIEKDRQGEMNSPISNKIG